MRNYFTRFEHIFTVLAVVIYSGGLFPVILSGGFSEGDQEAGVPQEYPLMKLIFAFTYLVFAGLLALRWKKAIHILSKDKLIVALIGLVFLSILWSASPEITLIRSIAFLGTNLFGLYVATRYTFKQQLQLLGWAFGLIILFSFIYAIALPKYGIMGGVHAGAWRGIYDHKNTLGNIMALSSAIFLMLLFGFRHSRALASLGLSLSVMLLFLSESTTSLVVLLVMLVTFFVCQSLCNRYHVMIVSLSSIVIVGSCLSAWLISNSTILFDILGKDSTLTGRTDMWSLIVAKISERPWLGYGYEGFWQGWRSEAADILNAVRWTVPSAHNGFLDLAIQLGLIGSIIFACGYFTYLSKILTRLHISMRPELIWPVMFFVTLVVSNITESNLIGRNSLYWVIYVSIAFSSLMPDEESLYLRSIKSDEKQKVFLKKKTQNQLQ